MKKKILSDADAYSVKSSLHQVILMSYQSDYSLLENFKLANKPVIVMRSFYEAWLTVPMYIKIYRAKTYNDHGSFLRDNTVSIMHTHTHINRLSTAEYVNNKQCVSICRHTPFSVDTWSSWKLSTYEMQVVVNFSMWRWQADVTIVCYYVSLCAEEKCDIVNFLNKTFPQYWKYFATFSWLSMIYNIILLKLTGDEILFWTTVTWPREWEIR